MAPPRRILRQQLEILMDFLEENKDMSKGLPPGTPVSHQATRQKWAVLAKQLNAVQSGALKTPDGWKKYWFEWRHKCRRKASDARRYQSSNDGNTNRFIPLNDLEVRVLELSGKGTVTPVASTSKQLENFLAEDSDSEPLENVKIRSATASSNSKKPTKTLDDDTRALTPPPKWALEIEERRITAEERIANALESIAIVMRTQEERRSMLEERIADAITALAGTVQDLNSGVQEAVQHLQQLHPLQVNGMEALETSINYWEDALAAFSLGARGGVSGALALTSPEEAEFCREIQELLQNAYLLQERCELLFLDQRSVLFRSESGGGGDRVGGGGQTEGTRSRLLSTHTGSSHTKRDHHSSAESFASAEDQVADLREFDDLSELSPELDSFELYQNSLKQLESGIPYRTLRTDVVQCGSDSEFLCKLHCLRGAFQEVFRDAAQWAWFVDAGRQVLTDLLLYADKEPKEFLVAYEEMVSWTSDGANWSTIQSELFSKGVKVLSFYDVVLDYILLDAFEDLASPPSSVLAVVRNRWLSDGFKESALTTAVWSVIKAKRRYLQYPDGFMAHFYSISEHLLPVLVWGFLGPHERLRDVCEAFQAEVVGFITDIFSFHKCRYTTVEDLATDILQHARVRASNITDKLADRA
ncbi:unnamed protein product [Diatraea saccharalis]|uniref:Regulatory protein zeste n=1 Tax=Diatraea saccharalis TaxID=40085 RepID=A0A9N9QVM7_9NEOP|nr:unnamed protein product [Diatraea saccharalis]